MDKVGQDNSGHHSAGEQIAIGAAPFIRHVRLIGAEHAQVTDSPVRVLTT
jgi:hypothetical protein